MWTVRNDYGIDFGVMVYVDDVYGLANKYSYN